MNQQPVLTPDEIRRQKTLGALKKQLRDASDLPGFSRTINIVQKNVSSVRTNVNTLTDDILEDFALTNKILKTVNTASYASTHKSGKISTITRAIFVLGFDAVRNAAISMMILEDMENQSLATDVKDSAIMSMMSGNIARDLAARIGIRNAEEAFVCTMFHDLGKMLTTFYLPQQAEIIKKAIRRGKDETSASFAELGISFEELGAYMGKEWHFSDSVLNSMRKIPKDAAILKPSSNDEQLRNLANFASELCAIINETGAAPNIEELTKLITRYENSFPISVEVIAEILETSLEEMAGYSEEFKAKLDQSPFIAKLTAVLENVQIDDTLEYETISPADSIMADVNSLLEAEDDDGLSEEEEVHTEVDKKKQRMRAEEILLKGIENITKSMLGNKSFDELLRMILDIMYRALGFSRVMFAIKSPKSPIVIGRYGFGNDIDYFIRNFQFAIDRSSDDVFNAVLEQGSDVIIRSIHDPRVSASIPEWYKRLARVETFLLFSVTVERKSIGLIYADKPSAGDIDIPNELQKHLKTLRDQVILAIKHSQKKG
ncbi:MAG: HDOD domain-containing protein [Nitrospirae bacterium]|nr:HDOD domain-containing protein [Nitrospirota bacterium]MBF0541927.1 HDOD domain-containing protein [Nitrospirota bacterium]